MNTDQIASKQSDLGPYCLKYIVHIKISNACKYIYQIYWVCSRINVWFPNMCKQTLQALSRLLLVRAHTVHAWKTSQWDCSFRHPKYKINFWIKKIITNLRLNNSLIWNYSCNQRNLYAIVICQKWREILIVRLTPALPPEDCFNLDKQCRPWGNTTLYIRDFIRVFTDCQRSCLPYTEWKGLI